MTTIEELYSRLENTDKNEFYKIEPDFFMYLYSLYREEPVTLINAYLIVSSWHGTSLRSGVWTFYESTDKARIEEAVSYLKDNGDTELADMIRRGIHNYQTPEYIENLNYPDEWIDESDEIDDWISDNEEKIYEWLYSFILKNKKIIELG